MTEPSLTAPPQPPQPQRLLFLHGLFRKTYPNSGRTVAELLAKGLDGAVVSAAPDLLLDDGGRCPRYLVQPESDAAAWQTVEVVEVVYDDIIKARDGGRSLVQRGAALIRTLVAGIPRLARLLLPGTPRITARQFGAIVTMTGVLIIAVVLMLAVLIPIACGALGRLSKVPECPEILRLGLTASDPLAGSIALLALLAVAIKLFVRKSFSEAREDAEGAIVAATDYQRPGSRLRQALLGRVGSALRAGSGPDDDRPVSILAFSQGSLLAIDALFPTQVAAGQEPGQEPAPRPRIDLLVTLGCPLAIVARLWPDRPHRPLASQAPVRRWINYYETHDLLGGVIAKLIEAEGIGVEVEDRQFSYTDASGRPLDTPHFAYWRDGPKDQRPSTTLVAAELARVG